MRILARGALMVALVGVIAASTVTLLAGPDAPQNLSATRGTVAADLGVTGGGGHWLSCPWPPCMAPCQYPPPPEVLCKPRNGPATVTSFTCCCCGGSNGTRYSPI